MSWTKERVETLRKLWADGYSASQCANEIGMSRNAVIGKVHRLGISERTKGEISRPKKSEKVSAPKQIATPKKPAKPIGKQYVERPPRVVDMPPPVFSPVTLLDLRQSHCRFIAGDPTERAAIYCGAGKERPSSPYCAYHARICYNPAPAKSLKKRHSVSTEAARA
jgi:GcrA cell cycle regulator